MRMVFGVLLLVLLVLAIVEPLRRGVKPSMFISAVLAVSVGFVGWAEYRWWTNGATATSAVREVSGVPESVYHCPRMSEAFFDPSPQAGYVMWAEQHKAWVHYNSCQAFYSWLDSDRSDATEDQILALHVLIHEAVHVRGERSEAVTECYAMKEFVDTAVFLGAPQHKAQQWADWYRNDYHPRLRTEYLGGEC